MPTTKETMQKLESHERECAIRYENIEKRLDNTPKAVKDSVDGV